MKLKQMDEERWCRCGDPAVMLEFLRDHATERQLRLFACACVRRIWPHLSGCPEWCSRLDRDRRVMQVVELYADGVFNIVNLDVARKALLIDFVDEAALRASPSRAAYLAAGDPTLTYAKSCALAARHAAACAADHSDEDFRVERRRQARFLRDIFGPLPFRDVPVDRAWLAWNDGIIPRMAESIYRQRTLRQPTLCCEGLAVLADALEDAGCSQDDILDHLRGPGPHLGGCWAVDLLTGRR